MENVVNLGLPHVGEQIFESIQNKDTLIQCLSVSQTWKKFAKDVLFKRLNLKNEDILIQWLSASQAWKTFAEDLLYQKYKGKLNEACRYEKAEIGNVKLLSI